MPSFVSWISFPEARSRTHRLKFRMNAARLRSGESTLLGGSAARFTGVHFAPWTSHFHRRFAALNVIFAALSSKSKVLNGRLKGSYFMPAAADSAAASFD